MDSWTGVLGVMAVLTYVVIRIWRLYPQILGQLPGEEICRETSPNEEMCEKDPYSVITPLPDFDWQKTETLKLRPFKPKFHLTMGKKSFLPSHLNLVTTST